MRFGTGEGRPTAVGGLSIDLTGIERIPIRFGVAPHGSVRLLAVDAMGGADLGGDPVLRQAIRRTLRRTSQSGLRTLLHPAAGRVWTGLAPVMPMAQRPYTTFDNVDRNAALLQHAVESEHHGRPPAVWRRVLDRPQRFLDDYTRDCAEVWQEIAPLFGDLRQIMEREAGRIGWAAVRGVLPEFLASALPGATLRGRRLSIALLGCRHVLDCTLDGDSLTIGPDLAGLRAGSYNTRLGTTQVTAVCYPLPPARRRHGPPTAPEPASLEALLGVPRTALLRHLDQSRSASELAGIVGSSPATITYQVDSMVAAGLVHRTRLGRHVMISRTMRGDQLLDLYQDHAVDRPGHT